MPDASFFAEKALRCRELAVRAIIPEIADQLRLWADEFELMAKIFSARTIRAAAAHHHHLRSAHRIELAPEEFVALTDA